MKRIKPLSLLKSYFVTGTDTDVGKTIVTAGLAAAIQKKGINIGIMKPFAAGTSQNVGFKSKDTELLANAAKVNDPEDLVNPQFFNIPASPYTAAQNLGVNVDVQLVMNSFKQLSKIHDMMLVEGMGGIMTPILKDYFVTNLIREMDLDVILITRSRIGTVNHTLMTCKMCVDAGIRIKGIIINNIDIDGYPPVELKRDIEKLTTFPVLGIMPRLDNFEIDLLRNSIEQVIDIESLLN